ncbi:hypothetical protein BDV98DRAFT_585914 [Pterulicium gracile]|uniref:Uncharacterized protein n=1 Tax=Pterulicium gracile TaxID=1884261 RepID=A0A5C3Q519_9AGAR|nr:hypothetical protein BDV98DRAFT_585914 [Pterula gracilis]
MANGFGLVLGVGRARGGWIRGRRGRGLSRYSPDKRREKVAPFHTTLSRRTEGKPYHSRSPEEEVAHGVEWTTVVFDDPRIISIDENHQRTQQSVRVWVDYDVVWESLREGRR